ncbi:MAG TPA: peptidoglycan DD-metalloendopeptidase family protein [Thermoanaerobaculia bacterium]|nr:peptidoglycan DD-metalloendopeptidase family protein [Thermoanaerobaculia bacterium]
MRKLATAAVLTLLLVFPAHSQSMRNADLDRVKDEIAKLRKRLDNVRQLAQSAERELEEVDLELGIRTRELELAVDQERRLAAEQDAIRTQIDALTPRIAHQKADLRQRLVALYRLGRLSYLRVLLSLDGERNPIEAISILSYLVSHDARSVSRFQLLQTQLASRQTALAERGRQLAATRAVVEERRRAVASSHEQKQKLLATLRSQEYGQAQQLAALEEKARRLQRLVGVLTQQNRGAIPPNAADIGSVKGALAWPVTGELVERFGKQRNPKFSTVTTNNGVKIEAAPGTPVRAIFNGTVLYSQWFKGYGNLIILDHGNRVFSLYGNVKAPAIAVGDRITTGQPIAGVGESEDATTGYLYFEIRQDNRPEDPQKWLR